MKNCKSIEQLPYGFVLKKLGLRDPDIRNIDIEFTKNFLNFYEVKDSSQLNGFLKLIAEQCIYVIAK